MRCHDAVNLTRRRAAFACPTVDHYQTQSAPRSAIKKAERATWVNSRRVSEYNSSHLLVIEISFRVVTVVCSMLASGSLHGLRKTEQEKDRLFLPWRSDCLFFFLEIYQCVCVCVRECFFFSSIGRPCTIYVFALLVKVAWPSLFLMQRMYWRTDEQEFAVVSRGLEHWQRATGARSPSR